MVKTGALTCTQKKLVEDFNTAKFGVLIDLYNENIVIPDSHSIPINRGLIILLFVGIFFGGYIIKNNHQFTSA